MYIYYYDREKLCTVIHWKGFDVSIENFTDDIYSRAFGRKENVSWEDLKKFLESRCFPRNRTNAKEILTNMGLEEYDPFQIVKKTQGRMAEDDQWLKFVEDDAYDNEN